MMARHQLIRHCEQSEAIQGRAEPLWIVASPVAPRNDDGGVTS
jgi:hypothetical protein